MFPSSGGSTKYKVCSLLPSAAGTMKEMQYLALLLEFRDRTTPSTLLTVVPEGTQVLEWRIALHRTA